MVTVMRMILRGIQYQISNQKMLAKRRKSWEFLGFAKFPPVLEP